MASRIHVCPLSKVPETVRETGARTLVTLLDEGTPVERPPVSPRKNILSSSFPTLSWIADGIRFRAKPMSRIC